jgi:hypothetical protein
MHGMEHTSLPGAIFLKNSVVFADITQGIEILFITT